MNTSPNGLGPKQYRQRMAESLLNWAKASEDVLAWFWYGSYSIGKWSPGSDLDAAVLLRKSTLVSGIRQQLKEHLGSEIRHILSLTNPERFTCYVGADLLKVECVLATDPEQLAWLADSNDVPAPRLVLAFERDATGQHLASRAERSCNVDVEAVLNLEIAKFLEAFEASSRAHARSDAFEFYFHYNLALGRLARLVQTARHKPERLYLPPQLTNTRLRPEERMGFIKLSGSLYLPDANGKKRLLVGTFLQFVGELSRRHTLERSADELALFLHAVIERDYFWNVRDWSKYLDVYIRPGVIIRASTLTRWQSELELKRWLEAEKVRQIIDLRTDRPEDEAPYEANILTGINYVQMPILQNSPMDHSDRSAHYLGIVMDNLPRVVEVLKCLAAGHGCSVVHCYAGVDRTGVVMALLGEVLGVPRDLLLEDYAASGADVYQRSLSKLLEAIDERGGVIRLLEEAGLTGADIGRLERRLMNTPK